MENAEAAKNVFIGYRQLEELVKYVSQSKDEYTTVQRVVETSVPTYNAILTTLKECLALDPAFAARIAHLQVLDANTNPWLLFEALKGNGVVLRGTAHAFIELYLSPEEKKKAIGFHT